MGLFDKLKGAINFVTGGGAKVTVEFPQSLVVPGAPFRVKVTATSTGGEVKSTGVFVDLLGVESVAARDVSPSSTHVHAGVGQDMPAESPLPSQGMGGGRSTVDVNLSKHTFEQSFQVAPAFVLAPNETRAFEGTVVLPPQVQPTFRGAYAAHEWKIRGRVEVTGNDPDSGYLALRVGVAG